jgi:hypothetical protein
MLRSRTLRGIRALAVAILSAWLLYVLAINTVLGTPIGRYAFDVDPILKVGYLRAWSLLPGRIHANGLSIRSSDNNVEWILRIDDVRFDVAFLPLSRRRFEADHVRGTGVSFRARRKLLSEPDAPNPNTPPIDGFPPYMVKAAGPPGLDLWDDAHWRLWTVRLEDTIANDVREIWFDELRFTGRADVSGQFRLVPLRALEVGPLHATIDDGAIALGAGAPFIPRARGSFDLTLGHLDPRIHDVLRRLTLSGDVQGSIVALPWLDAEGAGEVALAGSIAEGVLQHSRATAEVDRARLRRAGLTVRGAFHAEATVDSKLEATVSCADVVVGRKSGRANVAKATLILDSGQLDLVDRPFADVHARLVVPNAIMPNLADWDVPLRGALAVAGEAETWAFERSTIQATLSSRSLAAKNVRGAVEARGVATIADGAETVVLDGARMQLSDVSVGNVRGWSAQLDAPRARLTLAPTSFEADVRVSAVDARPVLELARSLPEPVADLIEMPGVRATGTVHIGPNGFGVSRLRAKGGEVAVRGAYAGVTNDPEGAFVLEKGPFSVGVELDRDGAKPRLGHLDGWLSERAREIESKAKRVR